MAPIRTSGHKCRMVWWYGYDGIDGKLLFIYSTAINGDEKVIIQGTPNGLCGQNYPGYVAISYYWYYYMDIWTWVSEC